MTALMLASMALEIVLLLVLLLYSRRHVRRSFPGCDPGGSAPASDAWPAYPRVALIVPLTGNSPEMEAALTSLLNQPYPNYETVLVTRDLEDPATPLVRALLARHPHSRHIVSGPAAGCSQKNHNILAGVGALDDAVEILVFCDSTHQARPNFLRDLIHPLVTGAAVLTSGFHRIIPGDARVPTLGMLQTVLTLHLLHGFAFIALPWGGATAMLRSVFHDYGIAGVLGQNVLDDFPLGQRLLRFGIRTVPVATAILDTHLAGQTMAGWNTWLTRQLLYAEILPARHLAGLGAGGVGAGRAHSPGGPGRSGGRGRTGAPAPGPDKSGVFADLDRHRGLVPHPDPPPGALGTLAPGLLCQHFHGLLVLSPNLAHRHHRLARHLLPGHLGRQGAENYPDTRNPNGTPVLEIRASEKHHAA